MTSRLAKNIRHSLSRSTSPNFRQNPLLTRYYHLMTHTDPRALFKQLYDAPVVTSAQIRPLNDEKSYLAYLTQVQTHNERKTKIKTLRTLILNDTEEEAIHSTVAELVDVADQALDIQGTHQASLRAIDDKNGKKTLYVDIYNIRNGHRVYSLNVTGFHGAFCADPTFGRLRWSPCGGGLLYTADRRKQSDDEGASLFDKHRYVPSWGEQFPPTLQQPRVYYLDLESNEPEPVEVTTDLPDHSLGQPQFGRDKHEVIFTAYANQPDQRRLGIIYCQNRPSEIHVNNTQTKQRTLLSDPKRSVRSPRFVSLKNGKNVVVYLSNKLNGPHASNCRVESVTIDGAPYGTGWSKLNKYDKNDPGLYIDQLPYEPFQWDEKDGNEALIATTTIGSRKATLRFDLLNDEVHDMSRLAVEIVDADPSKTVGYMTDYGKTPWQDQYTRSSLDCLAAFGLRAMISQSTFNKAQQTLVYNHSSMSPGKVLKRFNSPAFEQIKSLNVDFDEKTKSWILYSDSSKNKATRGIILPHGGPHSATTPMLSPALASIASTMDAKIVMPNYRGSTGYGEEYLESLLGQVGTYDVQDCIAAMCMAESEFNVQPGNWCVYGGSHGGFLAAHLTGQFPDRFKCAIVRNPVISLATNATQSDIPDWCYTEAGMRMQPSEQAPNSEEYKQMNYLSPLQFAQNVQAATLLMAGADDQRVPNQQTRHWYHALKGHQKEVDMLVFKGTGHPLDSVEAETTGFEATLQWFEKYFQ